jgi:Transposase
MAGGMTCHGHRTIRKLVVASGSRSDDDQEERMGRVFVGHDWAEAHHDVYVPDEEGRRLARARLPEGLGGVARFHELVAPCTEEPGEVVAATETDRGLFVAALVAAGYQVLAVNPCRRRAIESATRRLVPSRTPATPRCWPSWPAPTPTTTDPSPATATLAEAVKVLARAHQSMIWTRQRQANQLRSTLREFYPSAAEAFDELTSGDALAVLAIAPAPALAGVCRAPRSPRPCVGADASAELRNEPARPKPLCVLLSWRPQPCCPRPWGSRSRLSWR